ncbi:MAG: DUF448 domain-containing protein [Fusobacteriaceae bacterium]
MSNDVSPERTCTMCREKKDKKDLFRIVEKNDAYVFDEKQLEQSRGTYVCKTKECVQRLSKHKKINISMEELLKMANLLKNEKKDYINILKAMRNSQALTFGINMVFDEIEKIHFIVMAEDISEKNSRKIIEKCKEKEIPYIFHGTKNQLGEIFNKDEITVIAVKNKRTARGLIN